MGGSYYVPRSVKGESRILYIFIIKSFAVTLAFALVGWGLAYLIGMIVNMSIIATIIVIAIFAAIGYGLSTIIIPDVPMMGPLRKAGGENIGAMLIRALSFRGKRKIYLYNYKREVTKGGNEDGK